MFSKKATKIDEIFTVYLTVTTYCQIDGEDFVFWKDSGLDNLKFEFEFEIDWPLKVNWKKKAPSEMRSPHREGFYRGPLHSRRSSLMFANLPPESKAQ